MYAVLDELGSTATATLRIRFGSFAISLSFIRQLRGCTHTNRENNAALVKC